MKKVVMRDKPKKSLKDDNSIKSKTHVINGKEYTMHQYGKRTSDITTYLISSKTVRPKLYNELMFNTFDELFTYFDKHKKHGI